MTMSIDMIMSDIENVKFSKYIFTLEYFMFSADYFFNSIYYDIIIL